MGSGISSAGLTCAVSRTVGVSSRNFAPVFIISRFLEARSPFRYS